MDHRDPNFPGGSNDPPTHRRARAYSQPTVTPGAGPSHRPPELPFQPPQYPAPSASTGLSNFGSDYDEDALLQALLAMSEDQQGPQPQLYPSPVLLSQLPPMPPTAPLPQQMQSQLANPLLSQTFVAWLQYMQLQMQLQQQHPSQQHSNQQHQSPIPPQQAPSQIQTQQAHAPVPNNPIHLPRIDVENRVPFPAMPMSGLATPTSARAPEEMAEPAAIPPADEDAADNNNGGLDNTAIAEEKRRRNTAASARFRIKKKQWTLNLERSITDLSGRVEELEREAAELRRENGWLKEIVMLKSKRFGGQAPQIEASSSQSGTEPQGQEQGSTPSDNSADSEREGGNGASSESRNSGKGKEVQR